MNESNDEVDGYSDKRQLIRTEGLPPVAYTIDTD